MKAKGGGRDPLFNRLQIYSYLHIFCEKIRFYLKVFINASTNTNNKAIATRTADRNVHQKLTIGLDS